MTAGTNLQKGREGVTHDDAVSQRCKEAQRSDGARNQPRRVGAHDLLPRLLKGFRVVLLADAANHAETIRSYDTE
jgi:hypothetical protein